MNSKRGQGLIKNISLGVIGILFILVVIFSVIEYQKGSDASNAFSRAIDSVIDGAIRVLGPIFGGMLGISQGADPNISFLMILTFLLVATIVVNTLDTINIFGDTVTTSSQITNLIIGVIVSVIGIRFMPEDLWFSLTAPSSAFVATLLVGIPFAALFVTTINIRSSLARKLLWAFYIIFMTVLIFGEGGSGAPGWNLFKGIYLAFLVAAGFIMWNDATVRGWIKKEQLKVKVNEAMNEEDAVRITKIQTELKELRDQELKASGSAKSAITRKIVKLEKELKNLLARFSKTA